MGAFPALSRRELAEAIRACLNWRAPTCGDRVEAALDRLEQRGQGSILRLPASVTPRQLSLGPGRTADSTDGRSQRGRPTGTAGADAYTGVVPR